MTSKIRSKIARLSHFNQRPGGITIDTIVVHSMYVPQSDGSRSFELAAAVSCLDSEKVSAHYIIARNGEIISCVDEGNRAWHAGKSVMPGGDKRENVNDFSIGIELMGSPESGFTDAQYQALATLTKELCSRHPIKNFVGHDDISPGRKTDPGSAFDWKRYLNLISRDSKISS